VNTTEFLDIGGQVIDPNELTIPKARELAGLLLSEQLPFVRFVEARRSAVTEHVVLDIEPEVPQQPSNDIRPVERIAVELDPEDNRAPDVLALRADFPRVPHLNCGLEEFPRSLCLFDEPYAEQKLAWTASRFLRQLHLWLNRTARNELHGPDQPLEQFLVGSPYELILPPDLFKLGADATELDLHVYAVPADDERLSLVASVDGERVPHKAVPFVSMVLDADPRTHGVIRLQPVNMMQLHDMLAEAGCDLLSALRTHLNGWRTRDDRDEVRVLIIARLPKRRSDEGEVEALEVWGFLTGFTISGLAEALGMMAEGAGHLVPIIGQPAPALEAANNIPVQLLHPVPALTRERAALLNGVNGTTDVQVLAIGCGALGSQLVMNLVRAGFGTWTVVDKDVLLPHNLARHGLDGFALGAAKAPVVSQAANSLFVEEAPVRPLVVDALESTPDFENAGRAADVILDCSASVTVARRIAIDLESGARRYSVFLNPSGSDLVLLAEDAARAHRLDHLEMTYYRALIQTPGFEDHLHRDDEQVRYANSCRDVTARMPQDALSVFAGLGARAIRQAIDSDAAVITLWRAGPDLILEKHDIAPCQPVALSMGAWTLVIDDAVTTKLCQLRAEKLPNETGGVLIGSHDLKRKIVYVVDTMPSPPDSEEWPTLYIRGAVGLLESVRRVETTTAGMVRYVGEWHSHPDGATVAPSGDDQKVFSWLEDSLTADGYPPLMAIVGRDDIGWFLGVMPS
jgi:hypothetical protein